MRRWAVRVSAACGWLDRVDARVVDAYLQARGSKHQAPPLAVPLVTPLGWGAGLGSLLLLTIALLRFAPPAVSDASPAPEPRPTVEVRRPAPPPAVMPVVPASPVPAALAPSSAAPTEGIPSAAPALPPPAAAERTARPGPSPAAAPDAWDLSDIQFGPSAKRRERSSHSAAGSEAPPGPRPAAPLDAEQARQILYTALEKLEQRPTVVIFEQPHEALLPSAGRQAIAATIRVDGRKFTIWIDLYPTGPVLSISDAASATREPLTATSTREYASRIEQTLDHWYATQRAKALYERGVNAFETRSDGDR